MSREVGRRRLLVDAWRMGRGWATAQRRGCCRISSVGRFAGRLRVLRLEPDVPVAGCKQSLQVAPDEEQVGQPTQWPERQTVVDDVDDAGPAWELPEAVLVAPGHE